MGRFFVFILLVLPFSAMAEDASSLMAKSQKEFDARNLAAAARDFRKALELDPKVHGAHLRLAQISRNGGDVKTARKELNAELQVFPQSDAACVELGNMAMADKNFPEALKQFQNGLDRNDKNVDALLGLGTAEILLKHEDNALKAFEKVIKLDPENGLAYVQEGVIYKRQGKNDKAKAVYQALLEHTKDAGYKSMARTKLLQLDGK